MNNESLVFCDRSAMRSSILAFRVPWSDIETGYLLQVKLPKSYSNFAKNKQSSYNQ